MIRHLNKTTTEALILCLTLILSLTCFARSIKTSLDKNMETRIHKVSSSGEENLHQKIRSEYIKLVKELKRLNTLSNELESLKSEIQEIRENSKMWSIDYFPPEEHDRIGNLYKEH